MDVSEQKNTKDESQLESRVKTPEELKEQNINAFYDKIDSLRKYFNPIDTQGPQLF